MFDVEKLLRIEVNLSMVLNKEEFMKHWINIGTNIYEFANKQGKEFNNQYGRKERQQEKRGIT